MKLETLSTHCNPLLAVLLCRLVLAVIFLYAAGEKIIDPQEFAKAIYYYQLVPISPLT
jgi:hypothetical protein